MQDDYPIPHDGPRILKRKSAFFASCSITSCVFSLEGDWLLCTVCGSSLVAIKKRHVLLAGCELSSVSLASDVKRLVISSRGLSLAVLLPVNNHRLTAELFVMHEVLHTMSVCSGSGLEKISLSPVVSADEGTADMLVKTLLVARSDATVP